MEAMKEADFTLDLRGESCPYPVIYTLEALEGMNKGELLQVITDCPGSFRNVPEEAVAHGYTFAQDPVKNGQEYFFIFMPSESGGYCRHQTVTGTTHTGFPQD